jgi:anti-anti-sigma factor
MSSSSGRRCGAETDPLPGSSGIFSAETFVTPVSTCVHVRGELDISTCGQLLAALRPEELPGDRDVNVDLGELDFIDAAGVQACLEAQQQLEAATGRVLTYSRPQGIVLRVLEVLEIESVLLGDGRVA